MHSVLSSLVRIFTYPSPSSTIHSPSPLPQTTTMPITCLSKHHVNSLCKIRATTQLSLFSKHIVPYLSTQHRVYSTSRRVHTLIASVARSSPHQLIRRCRHQQSAIHSQQPAPTAYTQTQYMSQTESSTATATHTQGFPRLLAAPKRMAMNTPMPAPNAAPTAAAAACPGLEWLLMTFTLLAISSAVTSFKSS